MANELNPMTFDPTDSGDAGDEAYWRPRAIASRMLSRGQLTPTSYKRLTVLMNECEDAYPYYSADGRPYVWAHERRWTAEEWNAAHGALPEPQKPQTPAGASTIVLEAFFRGLGAEIVDVTPDPDSDDEDDEDDEEDWPL